jgi:ectoine hydroxylase-related dioxygenase (phytanoyl-CoA dioxygenase family)
VREHIVRELKRIGVATPGGMPKSFYALPAFQQIAKLSKLVDVPELGTKVVSQAISDAVGALTQTNVVVRQSQLLVSPPNQGEWRLEGLNWHTDISRSNREQTPPIQAFVLLDDVETRGGGTLILAGSHLERTDKEAEGRIRDALRRGRDGEVDLRRYDLFVVELTGKAGDVYLMDMRTLHTPSINASKRFRMVATVRFFA